MKSYVKRIAATAVMTAVCLGATMQLGLPQVAYAVKEASDAPVMMTVDGAQVRKGEYADYFGYCKAVLENNSGVGPYLWSMYPDAAQQLVEQTDSFCLYARVVVNHFDALGLKLDQSKAWDYKTTKNQMVARLAAQGMTFDKWLESMGLSEKIYRNILAQGYYLEALDAHYFGVNGEKAPKESEVRAAFDKYFKAKHILIQSVDETGNPLPADELAKREALVQEIQERLAAGEDFDALMKKYSEDPGLATAPEGYLFQDNGEFMPEFVEGTKALAIGEISQTPVETSYGWHIIKREPLTDKDYETTRPQLVYELTGESIDDLLDGWMQEAKVDYPEGHEKLTIADVLGEEAAAPALDGLLDGAQNGQ